MSRSDDRVGVVTIGRNEGKRLERCLRSLIEQGAGPIVYVDSGSSDGSVELARSLGVDVVSLDMSRPFTMARGRNAGFERLAQSHGDLGWVQFVDGDCEVEPGWIARGLAELKERPDAGVVCGWRRERHPDASIYNRLIDLEWRGPVGEVKSCGGDAMYRSAVFEELEGFNDGMIAGEEPELCVRLRKAGWKVLRVGVDMTIHDADIKTLGQWWRRTVRSGHASAEGMALHGRSAERHKVKETLNAVVYGLGLPLLMVWAGGVLVIGFPGASISALIVANATLGLGTLAYARQLVRIFRSRRGAGDTAKHAALYAGFCVLGKVPEAIGIATYVARRLRGQRSTLIEYKTASASR